MKSLLNEDKERKIVLEFLVIGFYMAIGIAY
jgi:hypothetical protein